MIYWDTSALVPLLRDEPRTASVRRLLEEDPAILVWWGAPVECLAAIARCEQDGQVTRGEADRARRHLHELAGAWSEVLAGEQVREHAGRLLLRHRLRAGDALQLAAALTWARGRPRRHPFATLDRRLADAARGEGFSLVLPDAAAAPV
ncbi:MAG TPA: type II toxin-antitoxin system VapC family toxin [Thermoanaerobaculia bacterium]|nr:type II toxin-antitoxin system VapC family toxin [Thermoanaerobaculia bacterium]